jgi:hypothetical protein
MLAVLLEHDHGQQAGAGPAARDRVERGGWLADLLAVPAGELLTDGLDDLPLPGHHLQGFGDVLAHLHDAMRAAAGAGGWRLDHHAFAGKMLRERLLHRLAPLEGRDPRRLLGRLFGHSPIFGGISHQLLELQFQLIKKPGGAFRAAAVFGPLEQRDLELERRDHRLGGRNHRAGLREFGLSRGGTPLGNSQGGAQVREFGSGLGHGHNLPYRLGKAHGKPA